MGPHWKRAQDLAREAAIRGPVTAGKPKRLPMALKHAIKRGRRPKGTTEKDS
jgi:hypothetical protein